MARIFRDKLSEEELITRSGGDVFYLLMSWNGRDVMTKRLMRMFYLIEENFRFNHNKAMYRLAFKAGVYEIPDNAENPSLAADKARYINRRGDRYAESTVNYFTEEIKNLIDRENDIENRMEAALENGEFRIYFQPKYYLETEEIAGAEALVRWVSTPAGTVTPPCDFIPVFERNGFITKLDFHNFKNVCQMIKKWESMGRVPLPVSVNFSRNHLSNPDFVLTISEIADKYKVDRKMLEIEITESAVFDNEELLIDSLNALHDAGFRLSIDDFGTGYSSLNMLKNISVDVMKMDRGFFVNSTDESKSRLVISSVTKLAKDLGISTVAEGVETKELIDFLRELGCDIVQGYYYSKPMPENELMLLLKNSGS
jgi:EAL domain-containing protein (putative c-di-GMP-specific phosphodiesterase class I)